MAKPSKESTAHGLTATERLRRRFWTEFKAFARDGGMVDLREPSTRHYYEFAVGRSEFKVAATLRVRMRASGWPPVGVGCELYISHRESKVAFKNLARQKAKILSLLRVSTDEVEWMPLRKKHACRIIQYHAETVEDPEKWPALFEWLRERVETFRRVFKPLVRKLKLR